MGSHRPESKSISLIGIRLAIKGFDISLFCCARASAVGFYSANILLLTAFLMAASEPALPSNQLKVFNRRVDGLGHCFLALHLPSQTCSLTAIVTVAKEPQDKTLSRGSTTLAELMRLPDGE